MSKPHVRTKAELKTIHEAAVAVEKAVELIEKARHLGPANPPGIEPAERLVREAATHTAGWRALGEG